MVTNSTTTTTTTTTSTISSSSAKQGSSRLSLPLATGTVLILSMSCAAAFLPPPARPFLEPLCAETFRETPQLRRNSVKRSSPYILGGAPSSPLAPSSSRSPSTFGWVNRQSQSAPEAARVTRSPRGTQQRKGDLSKLFAAPQPQFPGQGSLLLVGLRRSWATLAQGSYGSSPILFSMVMLLSMFVPWLAVNSLTVWGFGRVLFWLSMRNADVSQRLPVGLIGYMSLFLVVGGLSFMNGLKAIALLDVV